MTIRAQEEAKSSPMVSVRIHEFEHPRHGVLVGAEVLVENRPWWSGTGSRAEVLETIAAELNEALDLRGAGWPSRAAG